MGLIRKVKATPLLGRVKATLITTKINSTNPDLPSNVVFVNENGSAFTINSILVSYPVTYNN